MPKIDSLPLSPTVSRIFDAFVKNLESDELDEAHAEALRQARLRRMRSSLLHHAFNANL